MGKNNKEHKRIMNKIKAFFNSLKAMRILAIVMTFMFLSVSSSKTPEPVTKEVVKEVPKVEIRETVKEVPISVEKTPQSCKTLISIDNDIFIKIGELLPEFKFQEAADYVKARTPSRLEAVSDCMNK
jgi:hypothetical protein